MRLSSVLTAAAVCVIAIPVSAQNNNSSDEETGVHAHASGLHAALGMGTGFFKDDNNSRPWTNGFIRLGLGMSDNILMLMEIEAGDIGESTDADQFKGSSSIAAVRWTAGNWKWRVRPYVQGTYGFVVDRERKDGEFPKYAGDSFGGGLGASFWITSTWVLEGGYSFGTTRYKESRVFAEEFAKLAAPIEMKTSKLHLGLGFYN